MGFRPAVEKIMRRLPHKTTRQTLLFSATMPTDVRAIASLALSENYAFVDTVSTVIRAARTLSVCSSVRVSLQMYMHVTVVLQLLTT
jgi:superfamily II DNA/RNA helicase